MKRLLPKALPLALLVAFPLQAQVVLSEVMFDLEGTDSPNEFVEFYNLSSVDTVDLGSWRISDLWSMDYIGEAGRGTRLPPLSYCVILEGDHDIPTGIYAHLIPDTALILKVDDSQIGNQLSSRDSLFLINSEGDTVDRHGWEGISAPGFSIERRRLDRPSSPWNWVTSMDSLGTPGFLNSVAPPAIDAAIQEGSATHSPHYPAPHETITLSVNVFNLGTESISGTVVASENDEQLTWNAFAALGQEDSTTIQQELLFASSGVHILNISVHVAGDENPDNDNVQYPITVRFTGLPLTLNEFHYAPDPGIPEFIELVNVSSSAMELNQWKLADAGGQSPRILPAATIFPGGYVAVSEDSSLLPFVPLDGILLVPVNGFLSLNNDGDTIFLIEPAGTVMDSLTYTPDWGGGSSRSVEKLHPSLDSPVSSNWGTCVALEKMTPGAQNSIFFESLPSSGSVILQPNPFSPDGDGHEDVLYLSYSLPFTQAYLTVLIFDSEGRNVRTVAKNLATASEGIISWDGFSDGNQRARIGQYIIKISAVDSESKRNLEWLKTAVLAEQLR